jgi:thymidylate synthase
MMFAQVCNLQPGEFIHSFGDVHLYNNHQNEAMEQLQREPRPLPKMKIDPRVTSIFDFKYEDFELTEYHPHPAIKAQVAI